ncbi:MAG: MFS transporter [Lentimonas sp.]
MHSNKTNAFLFACIVAIGGAIFGLDAALIAGTTEMLSAEFSLDPIQLGTVVSAPALGVLIALPFAGYVSNRFGRKTALIIMAIFYLVSAVASAFAPSYEVLVAARLLGGLAFSSLSLTSMYIGEISPPALRGKLVSMMQILIVVGLSGAYFMNYLIFHWSSAELGWVQSMGIDTHTWRWMLGSEIPFALVWFALLLCIPESPYWSILVGKTEKAHKALTKLMPADEIDQHIQEVQSSLNKIPGSHSVLAQLREIFSSKLRIIFIIALTIGIAQQTTGINAILFYAQTVFKQLGIGENAAFTQAIWVGLTSVVFTAAGLFLVDKLGRRPLIIWGMVWIIASLGICSYAFNEARYKLTPEAVEKFEIGSAERLLPITGTTYGNDIAFKNALKDVLGVDDARKHQSVLLESAVTMNSRLVLIGILSFIGAFHFSVGPVLWVLYSEIFSASVRGIAIPMFAIISSVTSYFVQKFFPWQLENMGMSSIFLFYASTVFVGFIILFFTLKETKGLSIEAIQERLAWK